MKIDFIHRIMPQSGRRLSDNEYGVLIRLNMFTPYRNLIRKVLDRYDDCKSS